VNNYSYKFRTSMKNVQSTNRSTFRRWRRGWRCRRELHMLDLRTVRDKHTRTQLSDWHMSPHWGKGYWHTRWCYFRNELLRNKHKNSNVNNLIQEEWNVWTRALIDKQIVNQAKLNKALTCKLLTGGRWSRAQTCKLFAKWSWARTV